MVNKTGVDDPGKGSRYFVCGNYKQSSSMELQMHLSRSSDTVCLRRRPQSLTQTSPSLLQMVRDTVILLPSNITSNFFSCTAITKSPKGSPV
jgi:hypothetical protein